VDTATFLNIVLAIIAIGVFISAFGIGIILDLMLSEMDREKAMQSEQMHLLLTLAKVVHAHVGKAHPHHQKMIEDALRPIGQHHIDAAHEYAAEHAHVGKHKATAEQRE
jgi:hypothetical protein